jgi:UDP-N-acetylmuramoyl-tripeptide--D-alanyl-D-alanine ligase
MELELKDVLEASGGRLLQGPGGGAIKGVSTDTRTIEAGEIFFALKGKNFEGHAFTGVAASRGAWGVVVGRETNGLPRSFNVIRVEDTLKALGDLAIHVRTSKRVPLVAIGGSSGKTTTKEMAVSILGIKRKILKTEGNRNNTIGLPLTLFGLNDVHDAAVVELGISEHGEMTRLAEISKPDVAVITNIGRGHLESLGTLEGVMEAKKELFTSLGPDAVMVVNLDDPLVVKISEDIEALGQAAAEKITFGSPEGADVRIARVDCGSGPDVFNVEYDLRSERITVGYHSPLVSNAHNGAAAIAAALPLGVSKEEILEGLNSYRPPRGRMESIHVGAVTVLDDTYNANPESMAAALETLQKLTRPKGAARAVAVLGDMLELGSVSEDAHREVGRLAGGYGVEVLFTLGDRADAVKQGAIEAGMRQDKILCFRDKALALSALKEVLTEGDVVLVKGSRGVGMEDIVEGLKGFN